MISGMTESGQIDDLWGKTAMKIYTQTGDSGSTSLIGGQRVSKDDPRLEAYGSVDELVASLGVLMDLGIDANTRSFLLRISDRLMVCSSRLAASDPVALEKLPLLSCEDVSMLEAAIDLISDDLPPVKYFTFPCGHLTVSYANVARTVCRRAERAVVRLSVTAPVEGMILRYLNRLSDYLYVLSRKFKKEFSVEEIPWRPK